ncbi:MAG: PaaI family thioesterase [Proteobacteria bacterium]|nr:PaaI family thioesterase [Pseudomonadota bacterium]
MPDRKVNLIDFMPFAQTLGLTIVSAEKDRVVGQLTVVQALCTTGKIMHGGAIMSVADTLGAIGAYLNMPEDAKATTTIESKTNFLGAAKLGSQVTAETTPVHVGGRTSVWQTRLTSDEGKAVALVTQTQLVLR